MYAALQEDVIYNSMMKKIRANLRTCHDCQTLKYPKQHTYIEMNDIITTDTGKVLCADFLLLLPKAIRGLKHLIVRIDRCV